MPCLDHPPHQCPRCCPCHLVVDPHGQNPSSDTQAAHPLVPRQCQRPRLRRQDATRLVQEHELALVSLTITSIRD